MAALTKKLSEHLQDAYAVLRRVPGPEAAGAADELCDWLHAAQELEDTVEELETPKGARLDDLWDAFEPFDDWKPPAKIKEPKDTPKWKYAVLSAWIEHLTEEVAAEDTRAKMIAADVAQLHDALPDFAKAPGDEPAPREMVLAAAAFLERAEKHRRHFIAGLTFALDEAFAKLRVRGNATLEDAHAAAKQVIVGNAEDET